MEIWAAEAVQEQDQVQVQVQVRVELLVWLLVSVVVVKFRRALLRVDKWSVRVVKSFSGQRL